MAHTNKVRRYGYIQGLQEVEIIEENSRYIKCLPMDFYKQILKRNSKAKKEDYTLTYVKSMVFFYKDETRKPVLARNS